MELLTLSFADLSLPIGRKVVCSDSSGYAWAAHVAEWEKEEIVPFLRWNDRWRWRNDVGDK
eukprot:12361223-Karenia_brevis.AAC.1